MKKQIEKILFFDFDGVLCDSARETGRSAWFAGSMIWKEWQGTDIPKTYFEKFIKLRPIIETGYQAIALMKLISENYSESFLKQEFHFMMEQVFTSVSLNRKMLINLFDRIRSDLVKFKLKTWLSWHKLYPWSKDIIGYGKSNFQEVYIVSTKHKKYIEILLNNFGIRFNSKNIFGLETFENKSTIIENILKEKKVSPKNSVLIDDNCDTLRLIAANNFLKEMHLYLASWGYLFPETIEDFETQKPPFKILYPPLAEDMLKKESM